jgi:hypothetical protein
LHSRVQVGKCSFLLEDDAELMTFPGNVSSTRNGGCHLQSTHYYISVYFLRLCIRTLELCKCHPVREDLIVQGQDTFSDKNLSCLRNITKFSEDMDA